ncbi:MAG: FG-GAP repeat domain-containing protein [Candidatus Polarisedimenticolia bacterium]
MRNSAIVLASVLFVSSAPSLAQTTLPPDSADWIVLGEQPTGTFGQFSPAGDVDGDGYDDVAIGDADYDGAFINSGRVTFHRGSPTGLSAAPDWILEGNAAQARLSLASPAADVNGDGFDDVIVGGRLHLGTPAGPVPTSWTLTGGSPKAGDVNADGFADLAVFATVTDVHVFHGSPAGLPATPSAVLTVAVGADGGLVQAAFEDVNGDGYDDYVLSWLTELDGSQFFQDYDVTLFFGSAGGLGKRKSLFKGSETLVYAVSAGDVDDDGLGDLVLSLSGDVLENLYWRARGRTSGVSPQSAQLALAHTTPHALGDFNGDGFDDVVVPFITGGWALSVHPGGPAGLSTTAVFRVEPVNIAFVSLAAAGDVNGDGLGDLIARDSVNTGGGNAPRVFVFHGRPTP